MRVVVGLVMLAMLTQGAVASAPFTARAFDLAGAASADGAASALFVLSPLDRAFTFDATAGEIVVERVANPWVEVTKPGGNYVYRQYGDPQSETLTFTDATLASGAPEAGQAALVRALGPVAARALADGALRVEPVEDPRFDQAPDQVDGPLGASMPYIRETIPGHHIALTLEDGVFELSGDFEIVLVGPDYAVASSGGEYAARTGEYATNDALLARSGNDERHVVTLRDAVLRVDAPAGGVLLSIAPVITFAGSLRADDPMGDLPLPLLATPSGEWLGEGVLDLSLTDGRLAAAAPAPLEATGTMRAARTPPTLALVAGAVALAGLAVLVVALRRRGADEDPVALALLAMEDRRWADALPHLDRALRAAPADAKLLLDRALCLEETGRLPEARDAYESVLRAEPFNAESHYYYARTLARLRNSTGALAHLSRALTLDARLAELARKDASFAGFRDHPQFVGLLR